MLLSLQDQDLYRKKSCERRNVLIKQAQRNKPDYDIVQASLVSKKWTWGPKKTYSIHKIGQNVAQVAEFPEVTL